MFVNQHNRQTALPHQRALTNNPTHSWLSAIGTIFVGHCPFRRQDCVQWPASRNLSVNGRRASSRPTCALLFLFHPSSIPCSSVSKWHATANHLALKFSPVPPYLARTTRKARIHRSRRRQRCFIEPAIRVRAATSTNLDAHLPRPDTLCTDTAWRSQARGIARFDFHLRSPQSVCGS